MAKSSTVTAETLELKYKLSQLPSSQHKAGLAGLVLWCRYLKPSVSDVLEIVDLDENGASFKFDEKGLKRLFDEVYAASNELAPQGSARSGQEPVKVEELKEIDSKTNKEKTKKLFYYPIVVPAANLLLEQDTSPNKIWTKLWRDMTWGIMRGVPATRKPFEDRAAGLDVADYQGAWKTLNAKNEKAVDLPSTYFIGAQSTNAENVSFLDKPEQQFLLHFWTYAAQIFQPEFVDREGKRTFEGFVLAVPDILMLKTFCDEYLYVLQNRSNDSIGTFRPKGAVIDIPEEAGLESLRRMREAIKHATGKQETRDLVFGIDVLHTAKEGNNVRLLYTGRIEPEKSRDEIYSQLKLILKDAVFRRQRLLNLVQANPWYMHFDKLICSLPIEHALLSPFFAHDVRKSFDLVIRLFEEEKSMSAVVQEQNVCLESLMLKIMNEFIKRKLKDKYDLEWKKEWDDSQKAHPDKARYTEKRESIGKEVFYAIRSRSGEDFVNYFASTICSVPHWMSQEEFLAITKELYENTDKIRTLSLLALSARVARSDNKENQNHD